MITRPNKMPNYIIREDQEIYTGHNQINLTFKNALVDLLSFNYYDGTPFGKFKLLDESGKSKIYVLQKELQDQLTDFLSDNEFSIAYLVGYTGVGKTTLLRNYFCVYDRNSVIKNSNLIIYKSFQSDNSSSMIPISTLVYRHINLVIKNIIKNEPINVPVEELFKGFYDYICKNKNEVLFSETLSVDNFNKFIDDSKYNDVLEQLEKNDPLGYSLMLFKYILSLNSKIKSVVLIFDDIEKQSRKDQLEFISNIIPTVYSCLSATESDCSIKVIVSLRNYLMRAINSRQSSASRIGAVKILKNTIPSLSKIIEKRANVFMEERKGAKKDSYAAALSELDVVFKKLYYKYDDLIMNITQKNIYNSLRLFVKMLTNKKYIGKYETSKDGAFKIDSEKYTFNNTDVLWAFVYGEGDLYDAENSMFANILPNHTEVCSDGDIISLYIIRYYLQKDHELYGLSAECVNNALVDFDMVFTCFDEVMNDRYSSFSEKALILIKHLYKSGVLLKGVNDIEADDDFMDENSRSCDERSLLYLSPRGQELYSMLGKNALYFNIIRDDIDTELENNTIPSHQLKEIDKIKYYFNYIQTFFEKEKKYISVARFKFDLYIRFFGNELLTSVLLTSILESLNSYFYEMDKDIEAIYKDLTNFYTQVSLYVNTINREYFVDFYINSNIRKYLEDYEKLTAIKA